jgi:hypothetical protein
MKREEPKEIVVRIRFKNGSSSTSTINPEEVVDITIEKAYTDGG